MNRIMMLAVCSLLFLAGTLNATDYYLATNGNDSAAGTSTNTALRSPELAITKVNAGDTLWVFGGTYMLTGQVKTAKAGSGGAPFTNNVNLCKLLALPGEHPYFNATNITSGNRAIYISKNFWWIRGIEIGWSPDNGIIITSASNIVEGCVIHDCSDDGLTIGSTTSKGTNNLILNCDSYRNYEAASHGNNGDGFSAKAGCGPGNLFIGCRSYLNSDDGWDFYDNTTSSVILSNCWAFYNGSNQWNDTAFQGNGNGFKLGGAGTTVGHTLMNCVAFHNRVKGFDYNNSTGPHTMLNCTAFRNGGANYKFPVVPSSGTITIKNSITYQGNPDYDIIGGILLSNSWQNGLTVSDSDFVSLDPALAMAPRNADYSLPNNGFARLASGSDMIDAGIDVGLPYNGSAPDLGAYEFVASATAPTAGFTAAPTNGTAPLIVTFTDASTGTAPLSLSWDLGDSVTTNTAGGASFTHSYAAGTYTVTLVASNSAGASTLVSNNLIVATAPPPRQNIWISGLQGSPTGFSFTVNGLTSHGLVIIQASDDLTGWTAQYTNPAVTGTLPYLDSSATNLPNRFYRVEEQ
jgi:PKD repeat protein